MAHEPKTTVPQIAAPRTANVIPFESLRARRAIAGRTANVIRVRFGRDDDPTSPAAMQVAA